MRARGWVVLGLSMAAGALGVGACGVSTSGSGGGSDASVRDAMDAGGEMEVVEAAPVEAGAKDACAGVLCNGSCVTGSDCRSCQNAPLLCAASGRCVASCLDCADPSGAKLTVECFACDKTHQNPLGSCHYDDASTTYCLSGDYSNAYVNGSAGSSCECSDAGSEAGMGLCPGGNQVCAVYGLTYSCFECGQMTLAPIDGRLCENGLRCNAASHACQ